MGENEMVSLWFVSHMMVCFCSGCFCNVFTDSPLLSSGCWFNCFFSVFFSRTNRQKLAAWQWQRESAETKQKHQYFSGSQATHHTGNNMKGKHTNVIGRVFPSKKCHRARRLNQHLWGKGTFPVLHQRYKKAHRLLTSAIRTSKRQYWTELCSEVDSDLWGRSYKTVTAKIKPHPMPSTTWPILLPKKLSWPYSLNRQNVYKILLLNGLLKERWYRHWPLRSCRTLTVS